jgi:hypothetical protein
MRERNLGPSTSSGRALLITGVCALLVYRTLKTEYDLETLCSMVRLALGAVASGYGVTRLVAERLLV